MDVYYTPEDPVQASMVLGAFTAVLTCTQRQDDVCPTRLPRRGSGCGRDSRQRGRSCFRSDVWHSVTLRDARLTTFTIDPIPRLTACCKFRDGVRGSVWPSRGQRGPPCQRLTLTAVLDSKDGSDIGCRTLPQAVQDVFQCLLSRRVESFNLA